MSPNNYIIIGGAGYIGSHLSHYLKKQGKNPIIIDDLSTGFIEATQGLPFIQADYRNQATMREVIKTHNPQAIFHLASRSLVAESVINPALYYEHNVTGMLALLEVLKDTPHIPLIFSSSAAVFGNPQYLPIDENHPKNPINPYGKTKLMIEQILEDYHHAYGLQYGVLRYFNAAGAAANGSNGERHHPETHLIPLIMQAASGRLQQLQIYGNDYPTPDGTALRDYIHVEDLAIAHLLLASALKQSTTPITYNLGSGQEVSVLQALQTAQNITGKPIPHQFMQRRAGDPHALIANGSKAKHELGWNPVFSDIKTIISHAWAWELIYSQILYKSS
jgi:UDP-glucose 4-epimerase